MPATTTVVLDMVRVPSLALRYLSFRLPARRLVVASPALCVLQLRDCTELQVIF